MSMPLVHYYSADAVRALPDDGNRYETVHGELLVTPAPGGLHQFVLARLFQVLGNYLEANGIEALLWSPADISWGDDTLVQPDLFAAELDAWRRSGKWADITTLHLVIEALSPSTQRADRFTKRRLYQERNIPVYWIVDVDQKLVEVWTPDAHFPIVEQQQLRWRHPEIASECIIDLGKLFAR